jgi:Ser/Thr protein kinase RdoA (MazF antagonist)
MDKDPRRDPVTTASVPAAAPTALEPAELVVLLRRFRDAGTAASALPLGEGNVHHTYLVRPVEADRARLVLQRINTAVFPDPGAVMANIQRCCRHLEQRLHQRPASLGGQRWEVPRVLEALDGSPYVRQGDVVWRATRFIEATEVIQTVTGAHQASEVGFGLGMFHSLIADLPVAQLHDTLPGFHVTPTYLDDYRRVLEQAPPPAGEEERFCRAFVADRESIVSVLEDALARGELQLRPIHGDPKVNNVLFDAASGRAVALIDLDTVKPGLVHHDIGDCVRSACNRLGEETGDWRAVSFDADLAEALLRGYLRAASSALSDADHHYLYDAIRLISFELGLRFLTDHLRGDRYFRCRFRGHNLRRACVQFQLTASIESQAGSLRERLARLRRETAV